MHLMVTQAAPDASVSPLLSVGETCKSFLKIEI